MRRLYGAQIRKEAGVERVLKSKVGELERGAKGAVEKLAKELDLVDVLNRIKELTRQGEKELRKVMGPEAWREFVARARGRRAGLDYSINVTPPESEDEANASAEDDIDNSREGFRRRKNAHHQSLSNTVAKHNAQRNLPQAFEHILEELEELLDQTKPRVRAMVGETAIKLVQG